jgi:restriction endonuclease-like protein/putative AbiEi antitoxin of type IV toxin-antitoxin system
VASIASSQFGLISLAQAHEHGLSVNAVHQRISSGRWKRILPSVYRVAGVPSSWRQMLMATALWAPEGAVSHRAAAALWELEGCHPGPIELSTTRGRKPGGEWITLHRSSRLDPFDVGMVGPITVTTPTHTIVDLCGVVGREVVEPALDDALRRSLTSLPRLRWAAQRLGGRGRPGAMLLRDLLRERGPGSTPPASRLESRVRALIRHGGLPDPSPQWEIRDRGRLLARVDFAYPEVKLAIEADGYRHHSGRVAWQRDRVRRNALTSRGWRVLHVTWADLEDRPDVVISEIWGALGGGQCPSQR